MNSIRSEIVFIISNVTINKIVVYKRSINVIIDFEGFMNST